MVSKCAGSIAVDYHVQGAMLEAYRKLKTKPKTIAEFMLRLHYVPGGHGSPVSGHRGQNGMDVRQRVGTGWANVTRHDCRGCRDTFLNCQKIYHGSHGLSRCA